MLFFPDFTNIFIMRHLKMPPRFSFNNDLTSSVNIPLNSITFVAMVQTLQTDKCAHCFTKSFWMIMINVE